LALFAWLGHETTVPVGDLIFERPKDPAMQRVPKNRLRVAVLIYSMTNAVIFGAGLIAVLTLPALSANAAIWIPVVVVASLLLAAPVA
jgi:hypothetical protein